MHAGRHALYYPSRRQQSSKMTAFVDYALAHFRQR